MTRMKMFNEQKGKEMKKVLIACICTVMLASCGQQSAERKKLQAENDSLKIENAKATSELNDMLATLDDIEAGFQSIKEAENYLAVQQKAGNEMTPGRREQIRENMKIVSETLKKNREQIADLQKKLNQSGTKNQSLQKMIDRLSNELNENVEDLSTANAAQSEKINAQDKALHTAYYCFGTSKELKAQNILTKKGLFTKTKVLQDGFNRDYFITIDIREVTEIPLFAAKAKLQSNHPNGSYEFVKDEDGNVTLKINNPDSFWSLSKYLVIEVG